MWEEQSTNLKSSHIYVGRFPEEKTRMQSSPLLLPQCGLPTPPTQHLQFLHREPGGEERREGEKKERRRGEGEEKERRRERRRTEGGREGERCRQILIDSGGTCTLSSLCHILDLVNLRILGRYSDLAPVVPNRQNVCSEICRTGCRCYTRQTQTTFQHLQVQNRTGKHMGNRGDLAGKLTSTQNFL